MLPVSHLDLLIVLAFVNATAFVGFVVAIIQAVRAARESDRHFAEMQRLTTAVAGMVYQEEEKTRALLREHGWPPSS